MRIAFYAPMKSPRHSNPSGDRRMARLIIEALEQAGCEVHIISDFRSHMKRPDAARYQEMVAEGSMRIHELRDTVSAHYDAWITYHLYHKAPDFLGPELSTLWGIPYIIIEASYAPKQANGPYALAHRRVGDSLKLAHCVLQPNPLDKNCILPCLSKGSWIADFPAFLNVTPYHQASKNKAKIREEIALAFGIDPNQTWINVTAMMREGDKRNSYFLLSEALHQLERTDYAVLILGDGIMADDIRRDFADMAHVYFLGQHAVESLTRFYAACDLAVWPGINEAFGYALLEAQAAGLPVISSNRPGIASIVTHEQTGLLVPEGDMVAFKDAINRLLNDPSLRKRLSKKALLKTTKHHTIDQAAQTLKGVLDQCVTS